MASWTSVRSRALAAMFASMTIVLRLESHQPLALPAIGSNVTV
jgi:hypothetical protein